MDDEDRILDDVDDDEAYDPDASARGVLQCLRMLAEEATVLRMPRTLAALQAALEACRVEGPMVAPREDGAQRGAPRGARIH